MSSSLGFEPVLHNITADKVVFCYRLGDSDSLEVASYYAERRGLQPSHLIALNPPTERFISQSEFETTIELPLQTALENLGQEFSSGGERAIWVIIMGYNLPHAFYTDEDPYGQAIAIASRLHRLGKPKIHKLANFTYDRRGNWKYFDPNDAQGMLITSVIDAPTKSIAKRLIDRSIDVDNQTFVTGKVYIDPYGHKETEEQLTYQEDILDFINESVSHLGLEWTVTTDIDDPYLEPTISYLKNDSFYWGWYTPRFSKNLFLNQNERRVFLYNADDDSASDITAGFDVNGSDPWCNLAINVEPGYAACAGSVAAPGEDAYLRPRPFFESLQRGSTIGEAFLYASPFVDWSTILIGDPLMVVQFPVDIPKEIDLANTLIPNNEMIRQVKEHIEEGLAYALRQTRLTAEIHETNMLSSNLSEQINLLYASKKWKDLKNQDTRYNLFSRAVASWLRYIRATTGMNVTEWLDANNEMVSQYFAEVVNGIGSTSIDEDFVYSEGHWEYEFVYTHIRETFENVHFLLQVARDAVFSQIVVNLDTLDSVLGWKYEQEPYVFVQLIDDGFLSNFSGRRIKYVTPDVNYLTRTEIYYVRWRPQDVDGIAIADWTVSDRPMIVKR